MADDFLQNDGRKFLEMMERLARHQRYVDTGDMDDEDDENFDDEDYDDDDDDDDDDEYSEGDYDEDDEEEDMFFRDQMGLDDESDFYTTDDEDDDVGWMDGVLFVAHSVQGSSSSSVERMEEGRRIIRIIAAKLLEERVIQAYQEKVRLGRVVEIVGRVLPHILLEQVATENQERLLRELLEEEEEAKRVEDRKRMKKEEKKEKKRLEKEERDKKEAERAHAREEELRREREEEQRKREEEQRKREEEQRLRREQKQAEATAAKLALEKARLLAAAEEDRKRMEREAKSKAAEEKRLLAEKAAEEKRIMAIERRAAEEKRLAIERAKEENRLIAIGRAAEEKRLMAEKAAEEKRRVAVERTAEEKHLIAIGRAAEEKRLEMEKANADRKLQQKQAMDKKAQEFEMARVELQANSRLAETRQRRVSKSSDKQSRLLDPLPHEPNDTPPLPVGRVATMLAPDMEASVYPGNKSILGMIFPGLGKDGQERTSESRSTYPGIESRLGNATIFHDSAIVTYQQFANENPIEMPMTVGSSTTQVPPEFHGRPVNASTPPPLLPPPGLAGLRLEEPIHTGLGGLRLDDLALTGLQRDDSTSTGLGGIRSDENRLRSEESRMRSDNTSPFSNRPFVPIPEMANSAMATGPAAYRPNPMTAAQLQQHQHQQQQQQQQPRGNPLNFDPFVSSAMHVPLGPIGSRTASAGYANTTTNSNASFFSSAPSLFPSPTGGIFSQNVVGQTPMGSSASSLGPSVTAAIGHAPSSSSGLSAGLMQHGQSSGLVHGQSSGHVHGQSSGIAYGQTTSSSGLASYGQSALQQGSSALPIGLSAGHSGMVPSQQGTTGVHPMQSMLPPQSNTALFGVAHGGVSSYWPPPPPSSYGSASSQNNHISGHGGSVSNHSGNVASHTSFLGLTSLHSEFHQTYQPQPGASSHHSASSTTTTNMHSTPHPSQRSFRGE